MGYGGVEFHAVPAHCITEKQVRLSEFIAFLHQHLEQRKNIAIKKGHKTATN